ncbi:chemotaxis protein CheW [Candidatus Viridilinea mediisalina]|uniref:Chemotaxis protein CheW n=1 Tax=Candidatus Viridilinea mediisalina TaxID=2024553 RepID=A0A2A6RHH5_9CHLR|nr:chemotaxis protein CheW [Candidatus Viridilinea mediisalina]PDW02335.1 chemotaxis protein CheW [Candidatus Viridilinea mediisalina]
MAQQQPPPTPAPAETGEFLLVRVSDELYALPSAAVREVARWRAPTAVPGAPPILPGIISQRGVVTPIVDLRLMLGLAAQATTRATRLIIMHHESCDLALLVDAVLDLAALPPADLTPPPAALEPSRARLLTAVARYGDRPLALLSLPALIAAVQENL